MLPKGQYNPKETEGEILKFWLENKFYRPEYVSEKKLSTAYVGQRTEDTEQRSEVRGQKISNDPSTSLRTENDERQAENGERRTENGGQRSKFKDQGSRIKGERETYTNILPPPNANGNLHLGHMSGYAYQDLMGRFQRMIGKKVLLLPGKDHAGIQTEVVYERDVLDKQGIKKRELGREEFYKRCYQFCMEQAENARQQEKNLGLSADFDRELFTLDPRIVDEVLKTFIDFYNDDLIYRDKRLINWCPRCYTALADIDTEYKDSEGQFVYFKYAFPEPDEYILKIKRKYANKKTIAVVERKKGQECVNSKGEKYQWKFDYYGYIEGEANPNDDDDLDVIFIGFEEGLEMGDKLEGIAIGIMMRLDGDHKLLVAKEGTAEDIINKIILDLYDMFPKKFGGVHLIKFADYPDDKFYRNGFVIGTVRPETIFGDTAIACNPDDERYQEFIDKEIELLGPQGKVKMKIIGDSAVDKEFGTGLLKVTPAHAKEDWEIAMRHKEIMPEKQCIGFDGKMNHLAGKYKGMWVKEARKQMLEDMKNDGLLVRIEESYKNRVQICERCKYPIEPLVSYQWFLDTKPLKAKARELVEKGFTNIMPEGKKNVYLNWMDQPEDWCITRQLWWGYRVPVWYKSQPEEYVTESGEVKEKIGEKIMHTRDDYKKAMLVAQKPPGINLTVVRHGESEGNVLGLLCGQTDYKLTENGKQKAHELSSTIEKERAKFDLIISSTLSRARETAEILNKKLNVEIIESDLLMERNEGDLTGKKLSDLSEIESKKFQFQDNVPNGESISDVENRIDKFIDWVRNNYSDKKNILIVTHAGPIRVFLRKLGGLTLEESRKHRLENLETIDLTISENNWVQDEDVLDTWFSSGQWPVLTLLASEAHKDFKEYYPTQVMETGWDILIFWVTRMMLLCPYKATKVLHLEKGELEGVDGNIIAPFKNVYLHGLVLDKNGVKMSKSKGNGIDPFEMMQKYGTDALRLSFVVGNKVGQNYRLFEEKIEGFRNYCNKIWNVSKFILMNLENAGFDPVGINKEDLKYADDDEKMLNHIQELIESSTKNMHNFNFGITAQNLYESLWHTFADEYIEKVKTRIYTKDREGNSINTSVEAQDSRKSALWVLWYCLDTYMRLLHPFIPFITEKIWGAIPKSVDEAETLMYAQWPRK